MFSDEDQHSEHSIERQEIQIQEQPVQPPQEDPVCIQPYQVKDQV